jgi:hypothetical protein
MVYLDQLSRESEKCKDLKKKLDDALTVLNQWNSIYNNYQKETKKDNKNSYQLELFTNVSMGIYAYNGELGGGVKIPKEIISKYHDSLLSIMKDTIDYYDKWTKSYSPLKENL